MSEEEQWIEDVAPEKHRETDHTLKVVQFPGRQKEQNRQDVGGPPKPPGGTGGPGEPEPESTWFSEEALAAALVEKFNGDWRYVSETKTWYHWTGQRWEPDNTEVVYDLARTICRHSSSVCDDRRLARNISSARTIAAAVKIAGWRGEVRAEINLFDADPMLLNTPGGIVDLRTGCLGPHRREAYMSAMIAVAPEGDCPLFKKFLDEFTLGNKEYKQYLLRIAGYCLTGLLKEHVLIFLYGERGGEGKGVFVRIMHAVLGNDYSAVAMAGMFCITQGERHPTEIAALAGKRLIIATETQRGQEWDEAKLKSFSGGDPQTCRVSRGDPFTFVPQGKIVISGNHKPRMRSADGAMRRRLHVLPCEHHPEKPDLELEDKLKCELGGILTLMIEGAIDWQLKRGLMPPPVVTAATDLYFAEQNAVGRWFAECCERTTDDGTALALSTKKLYNHFKAWLVDVGERAMREVSFTERLRKLDGVVYRRDKQRRGWYGVKLKVERDEPDLFGNY